MLLSGERNPNNKKKFSLTLQFTNRSEYLYYSVFFQINLMLHPERSRGLRKLVHQKAEIKLLRYHVVNSKEVA